MPTRTILGAVGELAASRYGAFSRSQAAHSGLSNEHLTSMVDEGLLVHESLDVYRVAASPRSWHQRAYMSTLAHDSFMIGGSAARLHKLDGFTGFDGVIVAVHRGTRPVHPGERVVQLRRTYPADHLTLVAGIPCTSLARTLCDIARLLPEHYARAVDDFQRRGHSLDWLEQTAASIPLRQRSGLRIVEADLDVRRSGGALSESWFESLVERCLTFDHLPPLERQHSIHDDDGGLIARVDLAYPTLRLAVEANSRQFHSGPRATARDDDRDLRLAEAGWEVAYVGWADAVHNPHSLARSVERIAVRRARDLGVGLPIADPAVAS